MRRKGNDQKGVAIIIYNYPPGEENVGKAGYLNVFESPSRLLKALKDRGYSVTATPSGEELKNIFMSKGIVNSGSWVQPRPGDVPCVSLERYREQLRELPVGVLRQVISE